MTIFIGDVHGKYNRYRDIIRDCENTIQVGDLFFFFGPATTENWLPNPPYDSMVAGRHRFIRGNHDNPGVCREHSQYIRDGHVEGHMMFIGGGLSIDRAHRVPNYTYWENEECSYLQFQTLIQRYLDVRPDIMVTHDCPESVAEVIMNFNPAKYDDPSRTRHAFQAMLKDYSPRIWVFGHWHRSFDQVVNGTRFVCLAELEAKELS